MSTEFPRKSEKIRARVCMTNAYIIHTRPAANGSIEITPRLARNQSATFSRNSRRSILSDQSPCVHHPPLGAHRITRTLADRSRSRCTPWAGQGCLRCRPKDHLEFPCSSCVPEAAERVAHGLECPKTRRCHVLRCYCVIPVGSHGNVRKRCHEVILCMTTL